MNRQSSRSYLWALGFGLVSVSSSFAAHAQTTTFIADQTDIDIQTTTTDSITVDATNVSVTVLNNAGGTNAGSAILLNNTTAASNTLTLTSNPVSATATIATVTSSAGAGATVEVSEAGTITLNDTSVLSKTLGAAGAISTSADLTLTNAGTVTVSGGTGTNVIDIIGGITTIANQASGTITGTGGSLTDIIQVGATGTLSLTNAGTISSANAGATVVDASAVGATVSNFTNSGTITADSVGDIAIDVSGDAAATTLNLINGSNITGDIVLGGTISDTISVTGATTFSGSILADGTVGGTLDVNSDLTHGGTSEVLQDLTTIDVADGATLTIGATNSIDNSGALDLGLTGTGTLDITNITGTAIDVGANTFTIANGSTLATDAAAIVDGNIDISGEVSGTLTVANSTIELNIGAVVDEIVGGTGTNDLNINGAFTNSTGALTDLDSINVIGGNFTVSQAITGVDTDFNIGAGRTVFANSDIEGAGALTLDGTSILDIATGTSVTLDSLAASTGALINVDVAANAASSSLLAFTTATQDASNASLSIDVSGVTASTTATVVSGVTTNFGTVDFGAIGILLEASSTLDTGNLIVTVTRTDTNSVATNSQNTASANAIDSLATSTDATIAIIQTALGSATTAAGVNEVLESLNPATDGVGSVSIDLQTSALDTQSDRLALLRAGGDAASIVTGDGTHSNHFWIQGFGTTADQDERDGIAGFDADAFGIAAGVDTDNLIEDGVVGLSFAYGVADIDSDAASNAQTDIDTYQVGVYGSKDLNNDLYVDGFVSVGFNEYDFERQVAGSTATGDTDGFQVSARTAVGRNIQLSNNFQLIPEVSAQYTYLDIDGYTETGAGGAGLVVNPEENNAFLLGIGTTAAWDFEHASGSVVRAALRARYTYDVIGDEFETSSSFIAGGTAFATESADVAQSAVTLGGGLKLLDASGVEIGIDYDANLKEDFVSHTGTLNLRFPF